MNSGSQMICAATVFAALIICRRSQESCVGEDNIAMVDREANTQSPRPYVDWPHARLRKHADYQRIYQAARKQNSPSMSFFFRIRAADEFIPGYDGPRIGLTAGRVLGNAAERNRIKRRMRQAVQANLGLLPQFADIVLHPRKLVLTIEFTKLEREVAQIFSIVSAQCTKRSSQEVQA